MELSCQERSSVVVLEVKQNMAPHDRGRKPGCGGGLGVDFDLDGDRVLGMPRQPAFVQQAWETHKCPMRPPPVADAELDAVPLGCELPSDRFQIRYVRRS